jgi:hypothetical protein
MINFDFEKREFKGIHIQQAQFWQQVYPDISIDDILVNKIPSWLDANPSRAKKNWKRFIVNWLAKAQREKEFLQHINRGT